MEATKILMEEHRVIERVIAALEVAARRLDSDPSIRAGFFLEAADFIREFEMVATIERKKGCFSLQWRPPVFPRKGDRLASCWLSMRKAGG